MSEDFIQLPKVENVKKLLDQAKTDIDSAIQEESELSAQGNFIKQVIDLVEEKLAKHKDLNKLSFKEKIDAASHLIFLQNIIEDFFNIGVDTEDDFDMDEIEVEEQKSGLPKSGLPMKKNSGGGCCGGGHQHNH